MDEGHVSYPGRFVDLPCAVDAARCRDESAEVSRSRSSPATSGMKAEHGRPQGAEASTNEGDAHRKAEMPEDSGG